MTLFCGTVIAGMLATILSSASAQGVSTPVADAALDSVTRVTGVTYARVAGQELKLDLFLPVRIAAPRPVLVFLFGGGLSQGTRQQFARHANYMARRGFVGVTIDYRLAPGSRYPSPLNDAQAAVRWLRELAAEYRIDTTRVGVVGGSSGGFIAAALGSNLWSGHDWTGADQRSRVQAVVAFNPVLDLAHLSRKDITFAREAVEAFLGTTFAADSLGWIQASPTSHVSARAAPFLLLHGQGDPLYPESVDIRSRLERVGVRAELFTADSAAHGALGQPPWFEPTRARMETFLISVFGGTERRQLRRLSNREDR